jgi:hypothetical protein
VYFLHVNGVDPGPHKAQHQMVLADASAPFFRGRRFRGSIASRQLSRVAALRSSFFTRM